MQNDPAPPPPVPAKPHLARLLVLLVALLGIGGVVLERNTRAAITAGPMVQIPAPDTLTIVWEMNAPLATGEARIDVGGKSHVVRASAGGRRYEATLTGLPPGAECTYTVASHRPLFGSSSLAGPYKTKTAPPRGIPFRFVAFGDSGNASNTQADLARRIAAVHPDVIIHVGDLVYPVGKRDTYDDHFFLPNAEMIRFAPFMPALGNHDVATDQGAPLLDVFTCPRNGPPGIEPERCYWFDYGDARFVALDTNLVDFDGALTAEQLKTIVAPWLRQVLTDCDAAWKFAFFHHPFYTGSEHTAEGADYVKAAFLSVFDDCHVDMVFCGHNHLYERTAPMRRDKIVPEGQGVVYITTGAGGSTRYPEVLPPPPYMKKFHDRYFSFTVINLEPTRLHLQQIDENGQTIDDYTLTKSVASPM